MGSRSLDEHASLATVGRTGNAKHLAMVRNVRRAEHVELELSEDDAAEPPPGPGSDAESSATDEPPPRHAGVGFFCRSFRGFKLRFAAFLLFLFSFCMICMVWRCSFAVQENSTEKEH